MNLQLRLAARSAMLAVRWLIAPFLLGTALPIGILSAQPSLVILVRHAEKQSSPADDPSLTERGTLRARMLDQTLAHTTPGTIFVTPFKRTAETAAFVAARSGITPVAISVAGNHVQRVADAVKSASGVVLVVGHSNTIPAIITALGGPKLSDICDASFATLFVFQPATASAASQLVVSSYGPPDPAGATTCGAAAPQPPM